MSRINCNKLSEMISGLLNNLLAPRLIELEKRAKEEMTNIKLVSQSFKSMNKNLEDLNKNVKEKKNNRKKITNLYNNQINISKKHNNNNKLSKLNTAINSRRNQRTPDKSYYTNNKNAKTCFKKINKSELLVNDLQCKSITNSKILNCQNKKSKIKRKSKSQKKIEITPSILSKKRKNSKHYFNNTNLTLIKHNKTNSLLNKNLVKSCKLLPHVKKKLNTSKLSKNDELDLICKQDQVEDSRIYDLNPGIDKNSLNRKKSKIKNKKRSLSIILQKTRNFYNKKSGLFFDEDLKIYNDELLTSFTSEVIKKTVDNSDKSIIGDDNISDMDAETNIDEQSKIKENKNNNIITYSLSERIEITLEHIEKFLNKEDLLKMGLINKECFKIVMTYLISKREDYIDEIKESLLLLKKNNSDIIDQNDNNNNFSFKPFESNNHTIRTINLLNNISVKNFFNNKSNDINNKYIILIFDLFFISIGFKKEILSLRDDSKSKLNFYKNYFEKFDGEYIGPILEKEIKGKVFDNDTINTLYEYSYNFLSIITPNFFQKFSSEIGLFVFIIKNILEHVGITKDVNNKKNVIKLYLLHNVRININNLILQRLNKINALFRNKN